MRDMMRYVESRGAEVIGIIEGSGYNGRKFGIFDEMFPHAILPLPEVPVPKSILKPEELVRFIEMGRRYPDYYIQDSIQSLGR